MYLELQSYEYIARRSRVNWQKKENTIPITRNKGNYIFFRLNHNHLILQYFILYTSLWEVERFEKSL